MIALSYAKRILNALFHTSGSVGPSAEEEKQALLDEGVRWGISALLYYTAYRMDGYKMNGEYMQQLNAERAKIDASTWWYTVNAPVTGEFEGKDGEMVRLTFDNWTVEQRAAQQNYYPTTAFLALFTTMPDQNGAGYVEPVVDSLGNATTYIRVNLNSGILTGNASLEYASMDEESGAATIANKELIVYPEVYGVDWGSIVGIGLFEEEEPGTGSPVFWGRINESVVASTAHVPLFRVGDLVVTLS